MFIPVLWITDILMKNIMMRINITGLFICSRQDLSGSLSLWQNLFRGKSECQDSTRTVDRVEEEPLTKKKSIVSETEPTSSKRYPML